MTYQDGEIKDILPTWLRERTDVQAISYAIKQQLDQLARYQELIYGYAFVDGAPEYILDLMAIELNVRYYDENFPIETKRTLIKNSFLVAMRDGTTYAVNVVIQTIWGNGHVEEWYEYNGIPNHFRVSLNQISSTDLIDNLAEFIEGTKRKTARLDAINIDVGADQAIGFGEILMERATVYIDSDEPSSDITFYTDELQTILSDENNGMLFGRTDEEVEA